MEQNKNTALLVMDMQAKMLAMYPQFTKEFIGTVAKAIAHARDKQIPVIYVTVGFRTGTPEINVNNKGFSASKSMFANIDSNEWLQIHEDVAPLADEVVTVKRRVSAFTGSDLEVVLRAKGIQHIVLTGIATSGVVLSTVREAADKDYKITVLADGCGDGDEEVHRVLTTKIFPRQADVFTIEEWSKK